MVDSTQQNGKIPRKQQILQALAHMLEVNPGELITTANLAKEVGVSEAALYRHFPSKYKMYEALIEFIEEAVFTRISRILDEESSSASRCERIVWLVLTFAEKNPGLARLLYGDALVGERDKLRIRVAQFFDRLGLQFKQVFREAEARENVRTLVSPTLSGSLLVVMLDGKISQYVRSSFREKPTAGLKEHWQVMAIGLFAARESAFTS